MPVQSKKDAEEWANVDRMTVTVNQLADMFGISPSHVMRWRRTEGLPRRSRDRYPLAECLKWYLERAERKAGEDSITVMAERKRLISSRRIGQDLANARLRAEMLDASRVAAFMRQVEGLIAARLDEIPRKVVPQIAKLRDQAAISRVVSDAAHDARRLASEDIAAFAKSLSGPDA